MPVPPSGDRPLAGVHRRALPERVVFGRPVEDALPRELELVGRGDAFIVTNRSLAGSAPVATIRTALGGRCAGVYDRVTAHTPRACVVEGAAAAAVARADILVAVGGGSVIDAAKAMLLCLRHGCTSVEQLDRFVGAPPSDVAGADDAAPWRRLIAVPTTLSAAEFSAAAGVTDATHALKHAFVGPMLMARSVILDSRMTLATPPRLLLATGIKAIDHAVERITSTAATPYGDAVSALALRLLARGLRRLAVAPDDLEARSRLQYAAFLSMAGAAEGAAVNVSHAIGHVVGAHAGVGHGETSCTLLPAVLRWNRDACTAQQAAISEALERSGQRADVAIAELIAELGLPGRLRDTALARADFATIADKTMHERLLAYSRKPVTRADIIAILEDAW